MQRPVTQKEKERSILVAQIFTEDINKTEVNNNSEEIDDNDIIIA